MAVKKKHGLEKVVLIAKSLRGAALVSFINHMLETPGVYAFGEFLDLPCVKELSDGPCKRYSKLLEVFAYGTYRDYQANKGTFPPLSEAQKKKLRHLTIASLASYAKGIPYSVLQMALKVPSVRQLENVLIEAVHSNVIKDQLRQQLEVDTFINRDMRYENTGKLFQTLQDWCIGCESICCSVELQIHRVRHIRDGYLQVQQHAHTEVCNIRRMLAASASSSSFIHPSSGVLQPREQNEALGRLNTH